MSDATNGTEETVVNPTCQVCTFSLDGLYFAVDVSKVQEVIRYQEMTPVPLAPSTVGGLINLRGQIVTAIDMRARLGLPARQSGELPMNIVAITPDGVVSLLVDEIGDVLEVEEHLFERAPEAMSPAFREVVPGVFKLDELLLLFVDVERVAAFGTSTSRMNEMVTREK
jgi:purine-binding chemotaxis protein CheW